MTYVLISSIRRNVPVHESSGALYTFHLEKNKIIKTTIPVEVPFREWDDNPRGGTRGVRGISINNNIIAIGIYSSILLFNQKWEEVGIVTNPFLTGVHDILLLDDGILATCGTIDLLIKIDLDGNIIQYTYARDCAETIPSLHWFPEKLIKKSNISNPQLDFRHPANYLIDRYDRAHLNSVCCLPNGDKIISLGLVVGSGSALLFSLKRWLIKLNLWNFILLTNKMTSRLLKLKTNNNHSDLVIKPKVGKSALLKISKNGECSILKIFDDSYVPSHSLLLHSTGTIVYLNTTHGVLYNIDPVNGNVISATKIGEGFLRGVTELPDKTLLVGDKGEIIHFDLINESIVSRTRVISHLHESIYDIKILPDSFSLPPENLLNGKKIKGYSSSRALVD